MHQRTLVLALCAGLAACDGAENSAPATAAHELVNLQFMPAYVRLRALIADEYLPATRDTAALSALPDGEAWCAFNAKTSTTTDLTPAQLHQTGLEEVARIQGEMREVVAQVGFQGDLQGFSCRSFARWLGVFAGAGGQD